MSQESSASRPHPFADKSAVATAVGGDDRFLGDFYRSAFARFDTNDGQPDIVWNWAAFLIAPIWYLAKGMWLKAAVWGLALIVVTGVDRTDPTSDGGLILFAGVGLGVYAGTNGTYDLYLLHRYGRQGFERPRRQSHPAGAAAGGHQPRNINRRAIRTAIAAGVIFLAQYASFDFVDGWNTRRLIAGSIFGVAAIIVAYNAWRSFGHVADADPAERGELVALAALLAAVLIGTVAAAWLKETYLNLTG